MKKLALLGMTCSVIGLILQVACTRVSRLNVWHVDSLVKVFPDDPAGANEADRSTWLIARNGHASIQLAVRSGVEVSELSVEVQAPQRDGTTLEAETRWVDYVPVGSNPPRTPPDEVIRPAPALFPDPLREDFPLLLRPNRTQAIWITVYCPPDAEPGDYRSEVRLLSGEDELASTRFSIRVLEATLPAEQTLKVTNWFNLSTGNLRRFYRTEENSEDYWELLENIGRVMADHGQNVMLTPVSSLAEPLVVGRSIQYDFSRLDRWVETFERAGLVGTLEGGHLLGRGSGYFSPIVIPAWVVEGGEVVRRQLDPDDPRSAQYLSIFLSALYDHLKQKGWDGRYIQHVHDEPHDREAPVYERYAKLIREHLPGIPTIDAVSLRQDISFFADVCDIWVPVLSSFDHQFDLIRAHVQKGGRAWFYTCISPQDRYLNRFIDYSLLKVRLLHWFNFRHNLTGFLHWGANWWGPKPFENVQTVINSNRTLLPAGDNALVYPNPEKNSILSSIRLEAMRDGIEDFEMLTALAKKNPEQAEALAVEAVPHINDYVRDPGAFRKLHRRLLEALQ